MNKLEYRNLDELESFKRLSEMEPPSLKEALDRSRVEQYEAGVSLGKEEELFYNYAAKQVNDDILNALQSLADEQQLIQKYRALTAGEIMNTGEHRRVLHHLTRGQLGAEVVHEGQDLHKFYRSQQERIAQFSEKVHNGTITTPQGKHFDTVVQIGIGGSDLGPRALYLALRNHAAADSTKVSNGLSAHFISNVDPDDAAETLRCITPESTLFILVSKSGTTQETLANEALVLHHLTQAGITSPRKHIVCVTSARSPLAGNKDYLDSFFIDDFIGGRYSSSSAVGGTVLSLAFGASVFAELLEGAAAADRAAMEPKLRRNAAMLDALIGIWERNIQNLPSTAVLPYSQALSRFPAHLQQLDMESNGKRVNRRGEALNYPTGPVIFGESGTNGQHSFYQLLHQGSDVIPLQFVGFLQNQSGLDMNWQGSTGQQKLNANLAAQIIAFAMGRADANPNKNFPGERPSSILYAEQLSPRVLGALLAHFENKIMFQGLIWNINSFDQEGVQLGKVLTGQVLGSADLDDALLAFSRKLGLRQT